MKTWNSIAIVGVGLIGGAIGQAVLKRKLAKKVVGIGRSSASLEKAIATGAATSTTTDLSLGVADADLVIVCTPVDQIVDISCQSAKACRPGTIITDAGSTKANLVRKLDEMAKSSNGSWPAEVRFVGSHPIAGNEKRGPQPATGDLFVDRVVVVTPTAATRREDCDALRQFWSAIGARVIEMSPDEHDQRLAVTSHLPHLVSSAIAAATPEEYVTLTAGGWLDTTRVAAGDPELWRQIMLSNREHLLAALDRFETTLGALGEALRKGDAEQLQKLLAEAKHVRDAVGS